MMKQHGSGTVSSGPEQKKKLLKCICEVYSGWAERFPFACRKGCSDCCTQSVSMSSLEGLVILDFIKKENREQWLGERLALAVPGESGPPLTMNRFAEACLKQEETDETSFSSWNFSPCVFLEQDICTIYGARPFGCRSFGSLVKCSTGRTAEMGPLHLAINTVFTQIIEHLSSDGGHWGTMADILGSLPGTGDRGGSAGLQPARPIPGFLLEPYEAAVVRDLLQKLREQSSGQNTISDLIDNFMPIE